MESKFNEKLATFVAQKKFIHLLDLPTYNSILAALTKIRNGEKLEHHSTEQNYVRRYSIASSNGVEKLFKGNQEVVKQEQAFDILHTLHHRRGHAGRDIMFKELSRYFGLTREIVQLYLSLCEECELKKAKVKKGLVVKPILSQDFNSRCQVDLIVLQARPDGANAPISVGQSVLIPIPIFDRAKTDPRNFMGVVMEEEDGFYRIGTKYGIVGQKYSRNQIEPSSSQFITMDTVPENEISLRAAVGADSLSGSQGHIHCNCVQGCKTGKCKCKSLERLCNSRCHNSTSCKNK